MSDEMNAANNTDRELWREPTAPGDDKYYANSIHVTERGGIGINVGGCVFVKTLEGWHKLARQELEPRVQGQPSSAQPSANGNTP